MALRRWRRSVGVVLAVRRWSLMTTRSAVLLRLETGLGVCGGVATATDDEDDEGGKGACARWLRSKVLSSIILSSMSDLQGALTHTGSAPPDVKSAALSALSRLLDQVLDQSDTPSGLPPVRLDEEALSRRPDAKALVSSLQQHFLVLSQRLHSAEVERRSLRLEVANQKRGLEREDTCRMVPVQRVLSVCVEALSREQEAQLLIQDQSERLHAARQADAHCALSHASQSLSEARQEMSRKDRSLSILGKHLSRVQGEKRQLEDELRGAARCKDYVISNMKAAEKSYQQLRESLVQSRRSSSALPRPLLLPREHLEPSGTECIMGAPEVAACQSLLSSVSQLCDTCCSRIDWLEQEVSASRGHVTALRGELRGELQDACLRDNRAYVPLAAPPETIPLADTEAAQPVSGSDLSKQPWVCLSPAPSKTNPAPIRPSTNP